MNSNFWEEYSRQPFSAVWEILSKTLVQLLKGIWPLILVMFVRSEGETNTAQTIIIILIPVIAFITALLNYLFFRFRITNEELHVKSGVFSRKQITLTLHKIQSVHINQNWIQKIFNISELVFDSPGSEDAEVKLQLTSSQAKRLMSYVLIRSSEKELSFTDLLKLGITSNHFETLFILIGVFLSFLNNIKDVLDDYDEDFLEVSTNRILESSILFIIIGILAISFLSIVVSLFRTILTYINFRIIRIKQGFSISKGLINSSRKLVPFDKVQYVSWKTNWLRRRISMYLFEFHIIGGMEMKNNLRIKIPVTSEIALHKLALTYIPEIPEKFDGNLKVNSSFLYRNTLIYGILPSLIFIIPLFLFADEKALLLILLPVYAFLYFELYSRKFLISWTSSLVHIETGVFGNRTIIVQWEKIQSVKISQSLYQQRKLLADLIIHTAGGTVNALYIPLEAARKLQNFALYKVESDKSNPY